jgi:hypothetical protein
MISDEWILYVPREVTKVSLSRVSKESEFADKTQVELKYETLFQRNKMAG